MSLTNWFCCTDAGVFTGYDSLLVSWFSTTSKSGVTLRTKLPFLHQHASKSHVIIIMTFPLSFLSASPVEWPSKQPSALHVWGLGTSQGDSQRHPGSLRLSAQSHRPAVTHQSHQTAGGGGFSWIGESVGLPAVCAGHKSGSSEGHCVLVGIWEHNLHCEEIEVNC